MTENENSPENLRKFLENDDPAMVMMGLSMAKGAGVPEELLPTILRFYMWNDDKTIRAAAKSVFMKHAPVNIQENVKECWKSEYRNFPTHKESPTESCSCKPFVSSIYEFYGESYERDNDILCCSEFQKTIRPFMLAFKFQDNFSFIALEPLIKALGNEQSVVAAKTLGNIGSGGAVEPLIKALRYPDTPRHKNWKVRSSAAAALGKIGDKRAVEPLIKALKDQNRVRNSAETALGKIGDYAVEPLIKTLEEEYSDSAVKILGKIGDKKAVEPLIKVIGRSKTVIEALGKIGDKRAVEPLIKALEDEDDSWGADYARQAVIESLEKIGDKRAIQPLIKALEDEDEYTRQDAAKALGNIGDERAVEPLIKVLNMETSGYSWVREPAKEALKKLGHEVE